MLMLGLWTMFGGLPLASASEGAAAGGLDVKLFHEPLLPIAGTSVDLTPFVLMVVLLGAASALMRLREGPAWLTVLAQSLALGIWGLTIVLMGRGLLDFDTLLSVDNGLAAGALTAVSVGFARLFWQVAGLRQSARLAAQSASFSAFVLGIHPCACLVRDALYGLRFINADNLKAFEFLIVIVTVATFTMVWGRAFCGWVCPIGFVQEIVSELTRGTARWVTPPVAVAVRLTSLGVFLSAVIAGFIFLGPAQLPLYQGMLVYWVIALLALATVVVINPRLERRIGWVRYASLLLFAGTIYVGAYLNGVFCVLLKNILAKPTVILFVGVLATTLILSQAWCRFLCPEGALLGLLTRVSGYKVTLEASRCSGCNACHQVCPVEAIDMGRVDAEVCLYCCRCVDACPTDALSMTVVPRPGMVALPLVDRVGGS